MRKETRASRISGLGPGRQQFKFWLGFDVEAQNVFFQRTIDLAGGLTDAGEHDFVGWNAGQRGRGVIRLPETTSAPEPSCANVASTAWFELAFIA